MQEEQGLFCKSANPWLNRKFVEEKNMRWAKSGTVHWALGLRWRTKANISWAGSVGRNWQAAELGFGIWLERPGRGAGPTRGAGWEAGLPTG